jgi:hypothetical protein
MTVQDFGPGSGTWTDDAFTHSVHVPYFALALEIVHAGA